MKKISTFFKSLWSRLFKSDKLSATEAIVKFLAAAPDAYEVKLEKSPAIDGAPVVVIGLKQVLLQANRHNACAYLCICMTADKIWIRDHQGSAVATSRRETVALSAAVYNWVHA